MSIRPVPTLLLVVLLTLPAAAQKSKKKKSPLPAPPAAVTRIRQAMAHELVKLAHWAGRNKLADEARGLLKEATTLDPGNAPAAAVSKKLSGSSTAGAFTRKTYRRKLAGLRRWLAAQQKKMLRAELTAATQSPVLRTARTHRLQYLLSLPKGWTPRKRWPVLVTVEGAGCNWLGNHRGFVRQRAGLGLIVVTPVTFWNTNKLDPKKYDYPAELVKRLDADRAGRMKFDEEGLLAALADVRDDCKGQERFFITGFSGGGNLTWRMVFGHPEKLRGAAPACANFSNPGRINGSAPARTKLPVRAFQGDKDPYLDGKNKLGVNLNAQWEHAARLCKGNGFGNVARLMLPGVGHSACAKPVITFVRELLDEK